jgi:hypothetical protein
VRRCTRKTYLWPQRGQILVLFPIASRKAFPHFFPAKRGQRQIVRSLWKWKRVDSAKTKTGRLAGKRRPCRCRFFRNLGSIYFFLGTFAPFFRASDRPMAIACFLLLTRPAWPALPDRKVPLFRLCIALFTDFPAAFPYLAMFFSSFVLLFASARGATASFSDMGSAAIRRWVICWKRLAKSI